MRSLPILLAAALLPAAPAPARERAIGTETTIPFAAGGGLRDWQRGGRQSDVLWVRDRTEQWYQVRLQGPCRFERSLDTLSYTTDTSGTFDRFSTLRVASEPYQTCGVASIVTSQPPPGHVGARPTR